MQRSKNFWWTFQAHCLEWFWFCTDDCYWNSNGATPTSWHQQSVPLVHSSPGQHQWQLWRESHKELRWGNAKSDRDLRSQMDIPRCASPPPSPVLNRSKPASRKYWGEGHKEVCLAVALHLPCDIPGVFREGQTHSLHPHLHSFVYWSTENWDFLPLFSQYPMLTGTVLQFIACCSPLRRMVS